MPSWTPERRVLAILNNLDTAMSHLGQLAREAPWSKQVVDKLERQVGIAQQIAGRDLAREMSLPSVHYAGLHSDLLRIASTLPPGDPTRREILSAIKREGG